MGSKNRKSIIISFDRSFHHSSTDEQDLTLLSKQSQKYIDSKKEVYNSILDYLESSDCRDDDFQFLIKKIDVQHYDKEEFEHKSDIKGKNDSYICTLIPEDSVEEFIKHVNRTNISLKSEIIPSIFESNSFLNGKSPSLIEYAAFFGSILIFRYLMMNGVKLTPSLWLYITYHFIFIFIFNRIHLFNVISK